MNLKCTTDLMVLATYCIVAMETLVMSQVCLSCQQLVFCHGEWSQMEVSIAIVHLLLNPLSIL